MIWLMTAVTFVLAAGILMALFYAFSPGEVRIASRLARLINAGTAPPPEATLIQKQKEAVRDAFVSVGKAIPMNTEHAPRTQLLMIRAGYRSPEALFILRAVKLLLPIALVAVVIITGFYRNNPMLIPVIAAGVGFLLPEMYVGNRVRARQRRLRRGLPDALDLLVICVEAGLGLDQAILKVSQELHVAHPELSDEFHLVNLEMRIGKSRVEALRELARRTGLDDLKALVAMLIQTDRFGTSVAQSLRVFSDDMRIRRRQRAEEQAAKTTIKMVPPLVFFIFPALMVVILGPALIAIMRQLLPAFHR
jgi:tight adherence protein C